MAAGFVIVATFEVLRYQLDHPLRAIAIVSAFDRDFFAQGINDAGLVVGYSTKHQGKSQELAGFVYDRGNRSDFPQLKLRSINPRGTVVGSDELTHRPIVLTHRRVDVLPLPSGYSSGDARSINDDGDIVGSVDGAGLLERAVLWHDGAVVLLALPKGYGSSRANCINNHGLIVGYVQSGMSGTQAALWTGPRSVRLVTTPPGFSNTTAYEVSDAGWVIGCEDVGPAFTPFIWKGRGPAATFPPINAYCVFQYPYVNKNGLIVGTMAVIGDASRLVPLRLDGLHYAMVDDYDSVGYVTCLNDSGIAAGSVMGPAAELTAHDIFRSAPPLLRPKWLYGG